MSQTLLYFSPIMTALNLDAVGPCAMPWSRTSCLVLMGIISFISFALEVREHLRCERNMQCPPRTAEGTSVGDSTRCEPQIAVAFLVGNRPKKVSRTQGSAQVPTKHAVQAASSTL